MKNLFTPLLTTLSVAALVAGCAAEPVATTPSPSSETTPAPQETPVEPVARGVSGEVGFVSSGVAQVQDGSTQTAVRFTDATRITLEVDVALTEVAVGSCALAIVGEDGTATTVTVTEPVDGECDAGTDGGFPDGERPEGGFPGGQIPEGDFPGGEMPEGGLAGGELPQGGFPGGGFGTFVSGIVTAVGEFGLIIEADDATVTEVAVGESTSITATVEGTTADMATGLCLVAQGEADQAGGFDATQIALSTPGESGCVSRGFGRGQEFRGGMDGAGSAPGGELEWEDGR